jgi:hypothetical protein
MKLWLTAKRRLSLTGKLTRFWLLSILFVTVVIIIFIVGVSHLIIEPLDVVTPPELISSEDISVSCVIFHAESDLYCSK